MLAAPPVADTFRDQIGDPDLVIEKNEYRVTLPLSGTWRGLPLHSLVVVQWVESEGGFDLVFDATREQVLEAANRAGFDIPASGGEYRDVGPVGVNVGAHDGMGMLYCFFG